MSSATVSDKQLEQIAESVTALDDWADGADRDRFRDSVLTNLRGVRDSQSRIWAESRTELVRASEASQQDDKRLMHLAEAASVYEKITDLADCAKCSIDTFSDSFRSFADAAGLVERYVTASDALEKFRDVFDGLRPHYDKPLDMLESNGVSFSEKMILRAMSQPPPATER